MDDILAQKLEAVGTLPTSDCEWKTVRAAIALEGEYIENEDLDRIPSCVVLRALWDSGLTLPNAAEMIGRKDNRKFRKTLLNPKRKFKYEAFVEMLAEWGLDPVDYGV